MEGSDPLKNGNKQGECLLTAWFPGLSSGIENPNKSHGLAGEEAELRIWGGQASYKSQGRALEKRELSGEEGVAQREISGDFLRVTQES